MSLNTDAMNKMPHFLLVSLLVAGLAFAAYFTTTIQSAETEAIRYIEPVFDYCSFADIADHPDLANKVIYVDFRHTDCIPSLIQFESVPELKRHYRDRKDQVFLYLDRDRSLPAEKFCWKRMTEEQQLSGYHFFMTDELPEREWDEVLRGDSVQKAFPHYLIVDKGSRIAEDAPSRPSDENVRMGLDKLFNILNTFTRLVMVD